MLWHSDNAQHVSFLGSIHYLEGAVPDWVLRAHADAEAVVFEADLQTISPPPLMPRELALPALDEGLWKAVETTALSLGLEAQAVQELSRQYPFAVAQKLASLVLEQGGACFEQGPDAVLAERTPDPLGLETFPEFYRLVFQEPQLAEQCAALTLSLKQLGELPERFLRASERWRMGEPEGVLEALGFSRYFKDFPGLASGLFARRHRLWLPRARRYIQIAAKLGHRLLFVVGCSHLVGPQTFLSDLERCGYTFRRA